MVNAVLYARMHLDGLLNLVGKSYRFRGIASRSNAKGATLSRDGYGYRDQAKGPLQINAGISASSLGAQNRSCELIIEPIT